MNRLENLSRDFQEKKKCVKKLSFIIQFKTEFLLPFTDSRNVFRKNVCPFYLKEKGVKIFEKS